MTKYDLVIIGCGPGGEKAAAQAAWFGKKVAVIDRATVGGACVHTGTLPSKGLRESALAMANLARLGLRGIDVSLAQDIRVDELLARKEAVCAAEVARILQNLRRHGVDLLHGAAELLDARTVRVTTAEGVTDLGAEVVLIATGTKPHRPADIEFDQELIWDSDEVVDMASIPRSLLVYGAGVIGCEYASMFATLGVRVLLLEPRDRILPFVDDAVTERLLQAFTSRGVQIHTNAKYTRIAVQGDEVVTTLADGTELRTDRVLYAAGRTGNTQGLGLDRVGLQADKRGLLQVDAQYRTAVPNVYAVGDVIGFPALASTTMDQGRVAVCHAFGFTYKQGLGSHLPYGIYTIPECAMIGATEQELKAAGTPYEIGLAEYDQNARALLVGATEGLLKLVFHPETRVLLGVHIVGERASELVHIGMTVLQVGGTIDVFIDAVYNYPTLSELFKYAAYDGLGRIARRQGKVSGPVAAMGSMA